MKIFEKGIEISERDFKILSEDEDNIERWFNNQLQSKIESSKGNIKNYWMTKIMQDETITMIPKNLDLFIDLIFSRDYFKNREQRNIEEDIKKNSKFFIK